MTDSEPLPWPHPDLVADDALLASASVGTDESGRVVRARTFGGWDVTILPDHGLDIGDAWLGGIPVAWSSPITDARSLPYPRERDWVTYFPGGLVATCGLRNFGPAGPRGPIHGDIRFHPARDLSVARRSTADAASVQISGTVDDARIFDAALRLERRITLSSAAGGAAAIEVRDSVTNLGPVSAEARVLYHLNFGAPLIQPGTQVRVSADSVRARDAWTDVTDWPRVGKVADDVTEDVVEHVRPNLRDGMGRATITGSGLAVTVSWSAATLPHLFEWRMPTRRRWALALEPATSRLFGPEPFDAVLLEPGERREHLVRIEAERA